MCCNVVINLFPCTDLAFYRLVNERDLSRNAGYEGAADASERLAQDGQLEGDLLAPPLLLARHVRVFLHVLNILQNNPVLIDIFYLYIFYCVFRELSVTRINVRM
jgi:hypothetical protein